MELGAPFAVRARIDSEEALSYLGWRGQELDGEARERLARARELVEAIEPRALVIECEPRLMGAPEVPGAGGEPGAEELSSGTGVPGRPGAASGPGEGGESGALRAGELSGGTGVSSGPGGVLLPQVGLALPGRDIARHLRGASKAVLLAVTLGYPSEMLLRREQACDAIGALYVDACASALVEAAANEVSRLLGEHAAARGLCAGPRYSPGYGDLPLAIQGPFVRALGADRALGLSVTPAHLMVPTKSVTAVAGLFEPGVAVPGLKLAEGDLAERERPGADAAGEAREDAMLPAEGLCIGCAREYGCPLRRAGSYCWSRE